MVGAPFVMFPFPGEVGFTLPGFILVLPLEIVPLFLICVPLFLAVLPLFAGAFTVPTPVLPLMPTCELFLILLFPTLPAPTVPNPVLPDW